MFLAKPAGDMDVSYAALAAELEQQRFRVAPDPLVELPTRADAAEAIVREALRAAVASVYLLGDKAGFTPENGDPIVRMQLRLAAAESAARPFARLIWAPKILPGRPEPRDEMKVLADQQGAASALGGTDKLVGDLEIPFRQFVLQHLRDAARPPPAPKLLPGARILLRRDVADSVTAAAVGNGLKQLNYQLLQAPVEGDPAEVKALRERRLRECDAVLLCCQKASQMWVMTAADELGWGKGAVREHPYSWRSVIQLDPPNDLKTMFRGLPHDFTDSVIDATGLPSVTPEAVAALIKRNLDGQ